MRHHHAQAHAGWVSTSSHNQLSTTSSFSSSAAGSMLSAVPSNSSQSDIITRTDLSTSFPATKQRPPPLPLSLVPAPRTSSLASLMGQSHSRSNPPLSPVLSSPLTSRGITLGNAAAATGYKLKRALARRKKSGDVAPVTYKSNEKQEDSDATSRIALSAKQFTSHLQVFSSKKTVKTPSSPLPPTPPPKVAASHVTRDSPPLPFKTEETNRSSIIPLSSSISSAVNYMRNNEASREREEGTAALENEKENDPDAADPKDDWRKSDSTMTAKPTGHRPVSMADSLQSTNTIVPTNRRLSTPTESRMDEVPRSPISPSVIDETSPRPSLQSRRRNSPPSSVELPSSAPNLSQSPTTPSFFDVRYNSPDAMSSFEGAAVGSSTSRESPTLTRTTANGRITPSTSGGQPIDNHIRGRLAAWTAANHAASTPRQAQTMAVPNFNRPSPLLHIGTLPPRRQPASSFTSNFGPAAGLAKRAVERMGRAWGGITSSSSGHSSPSSASSPSSQSSGFTSDHGLGPTISRQSTNVLDRSFRNTPNAPSGSWSVASSSSTADLDAFLAPDGPYLGTQLRGPLRRTTGGAGVAGGIVFGRDLKTCCQQTAINAGRRSGSTAGQHRDRKGVSNKEDHLRVLETRKLPAIVVRCAQHLLLWGLKEEGLFRSVSVISLQFLNAESNL